MIKKSARNIQILISLLLVLGALFVFRQNVAAQGSGAIWTTNETCGNPQNVNHYSTGDAVYINGAGFKSGKYNWTITGQPGGASNHPGIIVASGSFTVDESGSFCFLAYIIGQEDGGVYKATFGNKKDNYSVNQITPDPDPDPDPKGDPDPHGDLDPDPDPKGDPDPHGDPDPDPDPKGDPDPHGDLDPDPDPKGDPDPLEEPDPASEPDPVQGSAPVLAQSVPAPVIAPVTGPASSPTGLILSAVSMFGLSGLSLGIWLKRRK